MKARRQRLALEPLEDRTLLATCTVSNLLDSGRGGMSIGSGQVKGDLRFCINYTNYSPGQDIIDFAVQGTIQLNRALPNIDGDLSMNGPGPALLTIDAKQKSRVLYVEIGANVEISGLTVTGGKTNFGGGIYNEGTLDLHDCVISKNFLTTTNDTVGVKGGGIYNDGTLSLSNCTISENESHRIHNRGGGIYNTYRATLTVENSLITKNVMGEGFSTTPYGVGIYNAGFATIKYSTISDNRGNRLNLATLQAFGGGIYNTGAGELLVDSSLIAHNEISGDYYAFGAGIYNDGISATIVNSTISGNLAVANGDSFGESRGGGIYNANSAGPLTISHSTIARNRSLGVAPYVTGNGGGISNLGTQVHMHHTIVAGNEARNSGHDVHGALTSSGYNLFEYSAGGSGYTSTDILDVNSMLGPLADNGGPTLTHSLLPGSPAIDAGDNPEAPEFDQRGSGFPRIVNDAIDIGAFEVQATGAPTQLDFLAFLITADSGALVHGQ